MQHRPHRRRRPMVPDKRTQESVFTGYCRQCWKKFSIALKVENGWTVEDIRYVLREHIGCCYYPDPRW